MLAPVQDHEQLGALDRAQGVLRDEQDAAARVVDVEAPSTGIDAGDDVERLRPSDRERYR